MEDNSIALEKPQNGWAGLKHWRQDLIAGLVVSLISLPFSLGIAIASGAPPICGLISAIVAGLILPFIGGSYVTVSGPAAGLAPVLLASTILLGRGDLIVGYPLLLVAICLTGLVQVVLAWFKAARFSAMFPASVVEGMLAAIGLLILAKQLPLLVGHKFAAHEFWAILAEAPSQFLKMDPKVFFVGISCLVLIFLLASRKERFFKVVPPQVIAAIVGLILGQILGLESQHLIKIPDEPFKHGIVWPNFQGFITDGTLWWSLLATVVTLTLIDGVESLATIAAIDKIDPFRRKSDPNRTLLAMGVSNTCSSLVGGLTIIPGGVKSTACIVAGGRTQWANLYNACFLIIYILLGRSVINLLPLSALGAIVIYTGFKLCAPKVWKHAAHLGTEQLFVFTTTILVTVTVDLLWGIIAGVLAKLFLESALLSRVMRDGPETKAKATLAVGRWLGRTGDLFRNPVVQTRMIGNEYHVYFGRPLVCFNLMHLDSTLENVPQASFKVKLHITDLVMLIDHTATSTLLNFANDFKRNGRGQVEIIGLDRLRKRSLDESGLRMSEPVLTDERDHAMLELARLDLLRTGAEGDDPVAFLDRITLAHLPSTSSAEDNRITRIVIRACRSASGMMKSMFAAERRLRAEPGQDGDRPDHDMKWSSLGKDKGMVDDPIKDLTWISLRTIDGTAGSNESEWSNLSRRVVPAATHRQVSTPQSTAEPETNTEADVVPR